MTLDARASDAANGPPLTDLDEDLTLLSSAGRAYWFEGGVVIQTDPTGFGDYNQERVVPWARIIEYHEEKPHA